MSARSRSHSHSHSRATTRTSTSETIEHNLIGAFLGWAASHDRVMYGTTAINSILPQELKLFADLTAPDFDVLSPEARSDADDLARTFRELGHATSVAKDATTDVHRVFVDGVVLTRVSQVPKVVYARLREGALQGDNGMWVAPVEYLRMALFYELSRNDAAGEWQAALDRLVRLDSAFNRINAAACEPTVTEELDDVARATIKEVRAWVTKSHLVVCGYAAAAMALTEGGWPEVPARLEPDATCMDVLSNDPDDTMAELLAAVKSVESRRLSVQRHRAGAVFPRHCILRLDGRPLVGVFHADRCMAYVKVDGLRVATLDTLLAIYLRAYVMGRHTDNLRCLCDLLSRQQYRRYASDKPIFKRFVTECYGAKR